jgi:hypothetical protein
MDVVIARDHTIEGGDPPAFHTRRSGASILD